MIFSICIFTFVEIQEGEDLSGKNKSTFALNYYVLIFITLLSTCSISFYFVSRFYICEYKVKSKCRASKANFMCLIIDIYSFIYSIACILLLSIEEDFDSFMDYSIYMFISLILLDCVLSSLMMYYSDFFYYTLGQTNIGCVFKIFDNFTSK